MGRAVSSSPRLSSPGPFRLVLSVLFFALRPAAAAEGEAQPAGMDLSKSLIAHYPFDKDASDASGNGHDAVNHGAKPVAEGKLGGAFAFDGARAYVAIPAKATRGLTWFTVSLWARTMQSVGSPRSAFWANPSLVGVTTGGWGSRDFGLMIERGNAAYFHGLRTDPSDMSFFSETRVSDDRWHHIAFVSEGPRVLLYVDGALARGEALWHRGDGTASLGVMSQTASGAALGNEEVFIGAANEPPAPRFFYRGLIDDVRIWGRALSPDEIASLCPKPAAPAKSP